MSVRFLLKLNIALLIVGVVFALIISGPLNQIQRSLQLTVPYVHGILLRLDEAVRYADKHGLDKTIERITVGTHYRPNEDDPKVIKHNKKRVNETLKNMGLVFGEKRSAIMKKDLAKRSK
jgi:hypothetical protein